MNRLQDRVCIVTGAGRGIGKGIAERFLAEGARVWICDMRAESIPETVAELQKLGPAEGGVTDVARRDQVEVMIAAVVAKWGQLDVVVNNAGGGTGARFLDVTDAEWDQDLDNNLRGTFLCTQIAARQMVAQGTGGSIINIGSTNGLRGQANLAPYGAAKAGVINLSMSAALELGEYGIRVNALCPGTIQSGPLTHNPGDEERRQELRDYTALKRLGTPADIAAAAAYLASDDASFVTGHALVVDGGLIVRQLNLRARIS